MKNLGECFTAGYAFLSAWADLLDMINVFPVTDGDTGINLRISLAPLRDNDRDSRTTRLLLARSATGNSGNIAAAFFQEFCQAENFPDLAVKASAGREMAWQAVASPCAGTMLTLFDSLALILSSAAGPEHLYTPLCRELQSAVHASAQTLPEMRAAGVVDSGALAMYLYFDGFFRRLTEQSDNPPSILDIFSGKLAVKSSFQPTETNCYCVDVTLGTGDNRTSRDSVAGLGESVVIMEEKSTMKVHLHTPDPEELRDQLESHGDIIQWSSEKITQENRMQPEGTSLNPVLHIITDAAGSISRETAAIQGITLLESYIIAGDESRPESLYSPDQIYPLMKKGVKVTTAQSSSFERYQHYRTLCQRFGRCLYLCVGSAFTGNYDAAASWKKDHDPDNLLTVLDTGAASGRLGLIALLTARYSKGADSHDTVIEFAKRCIDDCREYVFIDELKYLVAGGRISKAGSFFGGLLNIKPVISPTANEVRRIGVVHSRQGQLKFAMEKLDSCFDSSAAPLIILQYTDNKSWVGDGVRSQINNLLPEAEILLSPLSLSSGVHMGPGTWSIAFTPRT